MEQCPDEVLLKIYQRLPFEDVASLRLANRRLAEIGAEALIRRVRFHVADDSIERFNTVATHDILHKHVDSLVFEGNILANVGCVHVYSHHYESDHHNHERPQPPRLNASDRERRLYERNAAKFEREVAAKYRQYRSLYEAQQKIIDCDAYIKLIEDSVVRLPKLKHLTLQTVGRCKHVLSARFLEWFNVDCALPVENDTRHTKTQLAALLLPHGKPLMTIQNLNVHVLSPKFFSGTFIPSSSIRQAFQNLKNIDLSFRLEKDDRHELEVLNADRCYTALQNGVLREALEAAKGLQRLAINFDDYGYFGPCVDLKHILGDGVWPDLTVLNLDTMSSTQDLLMATLTRQPKLKDLFMSYFSLEDGSWIKATTLIRKHMPLESFGVIGLLEDSERMYPMHLIDTDLYVDDFSEYTLSLALEAWVLDGDSDDSDDEYHPLEDENFGEPDDLREEYGPFMDSDDDKSDMDCSE